MKTIKRKAEAGEKIIIIDPLLSKFWFQNYKEGDMFIVEESDDEGVTTAKEVNESKIKEAEYLFHYEYEVIEEEAKRDDEGSITSTSKEERIISHISLLLDSHWIGKDGILTEIRKVVDGYKNS